MHKPVRVFVLKQAGIDVVRAHVHMTLCIAKLAAHVAEPANDTPLCFAKLVANVAGDASLGVALDQLTKCTFAHVSKARSCAPLHPADAGVHAFVHGSKPAIRMLFRIAELAIKVVDALRLQ